MVFYRLFRKNCLISDKCTKYASKAHLVPVMQTYNMLTQCLFTHTGAVFSPDSHESVPELAILRLFANLNGHLPKMNPSFTNDRIFLAKMPIK